MGDGEEPVARAARLRGLARGAYKRGEFPASVEFFDQLFADPTLASDPVTEAGDRIDFGSALVKCGQVNDAVPAFQRAVELTPDDRRARLKLGDTLARLGRHGEAAEQFRALTALGGDDADHHAMLAASLRAEGDLVGARTEVDRALELDPDHVDARLTLLAIETPEGSRNDQEMAKRLATAPDPRLARLYLDKPPALWSLALQAVVLAIFALWIRSLLP